MDSVIVSDGVFAANLLYNLAWVLVHDVFFCCPVELRGEIGMNDAEISKFRGAVVENRVADCLEFDQEKVRRSDLFST